MHHSKKPLDEKKHFALEHTLGLRLTSSEGLHSIRFGGGFVQVQFEGEEINTVDIQKTMNGYLKYYKAPHNYLEDCCRCCAISWHIILTRTGVFHTSYHLNIHH